jgi:hypothetical protein
MRVPTYHFFVLKIILLVSVAGLVVTLLWNHLITDIWAVGKINYLQALGLFIFCRLLTGSHIFPAGFSRLSGGWNKFSPEERRRILDRFHPSACSGPRGNPHARGFHDRDGGSRFWPGTGDYPPGAPDFSRAEPDLDPRPRARADFRGEPSPWEQNGGGSDNRPPSQSQPKTPAGVGPADQQINRSDKHEPGGS